MPGYVEVIRGLGLGGAETLLVARLKHAIDVGLLDPTDCLVVNTRPDLSYYLPAVRELGVTISQPSRTGQSHVYWHLRRLLDEVRPQAAIFNSPIDTYDLKLRRALGQFKETKLVEVAHSTQYRRLYRAAGRALDRHFDQCIAVSGDVAVSDSARHFRNLRVVHAGVDRVGMRQWLVANPDAPQRQRALLGLSDDVRLLVSVGSLIPLKGHAMMLEAMAASRVRDFAYVIVGDGAERRSLQELADRLGLRDRVFLVGRQPDGWRWIAVAEGLVHPSLFEGLPVTLMEGVVLGVPIIAADVGGAGEVLDGADQAWLFKPGDVASLCRLLEVVPALPSVEGAYGTRGSRPSYWEVDRFVRDFYSRIGPIHE